jgi:hypothetical protein
MRSDFSGNEPKPSISQGRPVPRIQRIGSQTPLFISPNDLFPKNSISPLHQKHTSMYETTELTRRSIQPSTTTMAARVHCSPEKIRIKWVMGEVKSYNGIDRNKNESSSDKRMGSEARRYANRRKPTVQRCIGDHRMPVGCVVSKSFVKA